MTTPPPHTGSEDASATLERGLASYARREWEDAYSSLSAVDAVSPLGVEVLEPLAWSALLTRRDESFYAAAERVHDEYVRSGDRLRAARYAFWIAFRAFARSEMARANAWLSRSERLIAEADVECAEQGLVLLPKAHRHTFAGEYQAAHDLAMRAAEIGERFGDADLATFARNLQGRALMRMGRVDEGFALIDEAILRATAGALSPVITGLVYCSAIAGCHQLYAIDRAREYTSALSTWCDAQPQLVPFSGQCQAHRAELMQLRGAWPEAIDEARRAASPRNAADPSVIAEALYQQAEIHRLRGEFDEAEACYRGVSDHGSDPQPGLALLRLAQGRTDLAVQAVRRVLAGSTAPLLRIRYLPAYVEIVLAAGEVDAAREACDELSQLAAKFGGDVLGAIAANSCGIVQLAEGDACGAVQPLRAALAVWQRLDTPYLAARARVLLANACRALKDEDGAELELAGARAIFERLGAKPDLAVLDVRGAPAPAAAAAHNLSPRELEVLRLVASGKTNKLIARELGVSEKTIDRHVSNIFTKLDVNSRAAATAYAYEHALI